MATRSYQDAVESLNSLQSNAATLEAVRASGGRSSAFAIPEMLEYLEIIGYKPEDLNALKVIHITGTKGKGSTSAFTESIIRQAMPGWKIGLYTSPHLVAVRERIRINGAPLSESEFAKYYFEIWDRLLTNKKKKSPTTPDMPGYFRFITLMAYHVFLEHKVDATVLEVGVGGTYDSTNIVPKPIVTGITALGIDHVNVLGRTIEEIAWQKGGIFKRDVPAFTVEQPKEGMDILRSRAVELKASSLDIVPINPEIAEMETRGLKLGLAGVHQKQNASLAIALAKSFIQTMLETSLEADHIPGPFKRGLVTTKWPGRCQTVVDPVRPNFTWYLDGAHTLESLDCCIQWFVSPGIGLTITPETVSTKPFKRYLVFNCTSGRSGGSFLKKVKDSIRHELWVHNRDAEDDPMFFDHVIFCSNMTYADGHFKGDLTTKALSDSELAELKAQYALASAWASLFPSFPGENIHVLPSIEHAVQVVEKVQICSGVPARTLVAGSLHLVGGVVEVAGLSDAVL
ncbi:FolC bifunctional protein [Pholiota conissans]|uniref:Folylpolyglutamate synthase n=1 Tax=Pholiota conissans TaxID=109636 RepID=A0A9P6CR10_9AGAR|nr:FolC bifunctional protein [Pholiota conissans]